MASALRGLGVPLTRPTLLSVSVKWSFPVKFRFGLIRLFCVSVAALCVELSGEFGSAVRCDLFPEFPADLLSLCGVDKSAFGGICVGLPVRYVVGYI